MLINSLNNWFNNPSSHYSSQPNFNLSDYQNIDQKIKTTDNSNINRNFCIYLKSDILKSVPKHGQDDHEVNILV